MIAAYREPDKKKGKQMMQAVIDAVSAGVPTGLIEIRKLGRTLKQRATDILAFFDRPGTSNGPTEAINGRLEHLRGSALGFRNLTNYVARSLLEAGFRPTYTLLCDEPRNPEPSTHAARTAADRFSLASLITTTHDSQSKHDCPAGAATTRQGREPRRSRLASGTTPHHALCP